MFNSAKNGENALTAVGVVHEGDWRCVIKSTHWSAKPAHRCGLIAYDFNGATNNSGLYLIGSICIY